MYVDICNVKTKSVLLTDDYNIMLMISVALCIYSIHYIDSFVYYMNSVTENDWFIWWMVIGILHELVLIESF